MKGVNKMYNIGIPEIEAYACSENDERIIYTARASDRPCSCKNPACKSAHPPHIHSSKYNLIRDIKKNNKLVFIKLKINRYRCKQCSHVFPDDFTFYEKHAHITNRLKQEIVNKCIQGESFNSIANEYGINHKTVAKFFKQYSENKIEQINYIPAVLEIDEMQLIKQQCVILSDFEKQRIIEIKEQSDFDQTTYFNSLHDSACHTVLIGFHSKFINTIKKIPNICIVIAYHHVINEIEHYIDRSYMQLKTYYKNKNKDIKYYSKTQSLLHRNWDDLDTESSHLLLNFFKEYPYFYEIYMLKQTFMDMYVIVSDKDQAESLFAKWINCIPDLNCLKHIRILFKKYQDYILNQWDIPYNYGNSLYEHVLIIKSRKYKLDTFRERCFLEINTETPEHATGKICKPNHTVLYLFPGDISNEISKSPSLFQCLLFFLDFNEKHKDICFSERIKLYGNSINDFINTI